MYHQLIQLFIIGYYFIHLTESTFVYNLTNTNKILCYSCTGDQCETVTSNDDNVVVCNKNTQLCWAGFVDQKPYRTCASRYCTPTGVSLDSDIRIEMCCHSNLCNDIPLSWSVWRKWYQRSSTRRHETVPTTTEKITTHAPTPPPTTKRTTTPRSHIYVVNEIVDGQKKLSSEKDNVDEQENTLLSQLKFNASDPATFGITWERVPYNTGFSICIESMSKLFILIVPVLVALLF